MIIGIHQPQYLPWLGYFDKIDKADVFCFLDNVQFKKNEWQNRNRIRNPNNWQWLTVPVFHRFGQKINEVEINNNSPWAKKHFQSLKTVYGKAPYFEQYIGFFEEIFNQNWTSLSKLNMHLVRNLCEFLGLSTRFVEATGFDNLSENPSKRLVDICRALKADTYLAGAGGIGYMDLTFFEKQGITVIFQDFLHPNYKQVYKDFQSDMSIVDLLFNHGPKSLQIIRKANS